MTRAQKTKQSAGLMQVIACMNPIFRDEPGGLIVDSESRHEGLGLSVSGAAFYDSITQNESSILELRRLLADYDYPPDYKDVAVDLVIEQAELFAVNNGAE